MTKEDEEGGQTASICLFDFDRDILENISADEKVTGLLGKSGDTIFLEYIAMFLDLTEGGVWEVTDKEYARQEWSYDLPVEIAEVIKKLPRKTPRI
jgi:hypothetical protein